MVHVHLIMSKVQTGLNVPYYASSTYSLLAGNLCVVSLLNYRTRSHLQWNPDFSNLPGKRKLVRKIGSSKNQRWPEIALDLRSIFYNNWASKQNYHDTLVQFYSFYFNRYT